mgnify:CR=1 FL=1
MNPNNHLTNRIANYLGIGALIGTLLSGGNARAERLDDVVGPAMHDVAEKMRDCVKPFSYTDVTLYPKSVDAYHANAHADGKKIKFDWFDGNEQTPADGRIGPGDSLELTTKGPGYFATYIVVKINQNGRYDLIGYILGPNHETMRYLDIIRKSIESKCMLIS